MVMRTPLLDLARPGVLALCRLYFGLELRGTEHIPRSGPLVITPNHQTYADPPLVTIPVRYRVYYMAWDRLFRVPLFGWFIRRLRAFPVDIESRDTRAAREAVRLLRAGHAVMIFPEGGRSMDGSVGRFHLGAFRLAASAAAPVLPVTIDGGSSVWPPGRALPRPGRVVITYHPPVHPDPGRDPREEARRLAERTREIIVSALATSGDRKSVSG